MSRLYIAGSLAYDRILEFGGQFKEHILPDKLEHLSVGFLIDRVTEEPGGVGGNIAYNLSLLSRTATLLTTAGTDFAAYKARLESLGIETSSVQIADALPTASAYVMGDKDGSQITAFAPSAMAVPYLLPVDFSDATYVIVAPTCLSDMERFPTLAKEHGVPYLFDPGQQITALSVEALKNGIEGADAVFVNEYEFDLLKERTGWSVEEITSRARLMIVTLGEHGSRLMTLEGEEIVPAVLAEAKDATGAGDAYRAGFVAGMEKNLSLRTCARLGSTLAAFAVEEHGTQAHTPSIEALSTRYEAAYGEPWPL